MIKASDRLEVQLGRATFDHRTSPRRRSRDHAKTMTKIHTMTPRALAVWHLREAARLLEEQAAQEDAPARHYQHRCQVCGCPIYAEGRCTACVEGDDDADEAE